MRIACDFDGVICKRVGIPTHKKWENAEPMEGALDAIKLLRQKHRVYILTSNPEPEKVRKWLNKHGFPRLEVTNIKKPSQVYIDDRGLRFTNWQDIRKYYG